MLREKTVFGPIKSRRLGSSLGINLLPQGGKICNFDCIYCECGLNADGRSDTVIPDRMTVRRALEEKLGDCLLEGTHIDSITFSGDGEPTLNPDFAMIVEDTIKLRDAYCPDAAVSVLTNATTLDREDVFAALRKVDNPILKLDAPSDMLAYLVNQPSFPYSVDKVVEGMKRFGGDFILQTMFLKSELFSSDSTEVLLPWMKIVRTLKPRCIMAYTIDRPVPTAGLEKIDVATMKRLLAPLEAEGFKIKYFG